MSVRSSIRSMMRSVSARSSVMSGCSSSSRGTSRTSTWCPNETLAFTLTRPRGVASAAAAALGLVEVGEDAHAALVELPALGGELQLAGRAVHQLDPEAGFEPGDQLAHRRGRHAEGVRGRREAAALDHVNEGFHLAGAVDVESRHRDFISQVLVRPAF